MEKMSSEYLSRVICVCIGDLSSTTALSYHMQRVSSAPALESSSQTRMPRNSNAFTKPQWIIRNLEKVVVTIGSAGREVLYCIKREVDSVEPEERQRRPERSGILKPSNCTRIQYPEHFESKWNKTSRWNMIMDKLHCNVEA